MPVASKVRRMFRDIAPRYDFANDVLSLGMHRIWRSRAMQLAQPRTGARVVDLCCGTGDFALSAATHVGRKGHVIGIDFVQSMVELASLKRHSHREKNTKVGEADLSSHVDFICGDATRTPIPDSWADLVTIAFGIRNLEDPLNGLKEIKRILAPGGQTLILEFGQPKLIGFAQLFSIYSRIGIPLLGTLAAHNRSAYNYLQETSREFPADERFLVLMRKVGFSACSARPFLSGIAYAYLGQK